MISTQAKRAVRATLVVLAWWSWLFANNPEFDFSVAYQVPCGDCESENPCEPGEANSSLPPGMGASVADEGEEDPQGEKDNEQKPTDPGDSPTTQEEWARKGLPPQVHDLNGFVPKGGYRLDIPLGSEKDVGGAGDIVPYPADGLSNRTAGWTTGAASFSEAELFGLDRGRLSGLLASQYGLVSTELRWVRTANNFVYFRKLTSPAVGYDVKFYHHNQVTGNAPTAGQTPFKTVRLVKTAAAASRLYIEGSNVVHEILFYSLDGGTRKAWEIKEGTFSGTAANPTNIQFRRKNRVETSATSGDNTYTETRTVTDIAGGGSTELSRVVHTFKHGIAGSFRLIKEQIDPNGKNLTTLRDYYTAGGAAKKIERIHTPDGGWRHFTYNAAGMLRRTYSPLGSTVSAVDMNTTPPMAGAIVEESTYSESGDTNWRGSTYVDNQLSSRTWHTRTGSDSTGFTWTSVQAHSPSAGKADGANLITKRVYYPLDATPTIARNKLLRLELPNNQVRQYTYAYDAANKRYTTTVAEGPISGSPGGNGLYNLSAGTSTESVVTAEGHFYSEKITDITSGKWLAHRYQIEQDTLRRPTKIQDDLSGRISYRAYACCGLEWERDFDGLITAYDYDSFKNLTRVVTGYRSNNDYSSAMNVVLSDTRYERDILGRPLLTKRSPAHGGAGGSTQTIEEAAYNLAGEVTSRKSIRTQTFHHRVNYPGSGRVEVTSYPLTGSPSLYRTVEETYGRDGRLASRRVYASAEKCDSVATPSVVRGVSGDIANYVLENRFFMRSHNGTNLIEEETNRGKTVTSTAELSTTRYDALGRTALRTRTNAAGTSVTTETYAYSNTSGSSKGLTSRIDRIDGESTFFEYDARGRVWRTITDLGNNASDPSTDRVVQTDYTVVVDPSNSSYGVSKTTTSVYLSGTTPLVVSEQLSWPSGLRSQTIDPTTTVDRVAEVTKQYGANNGDWTVTTTFPDDSLSVESYSGGRLANRTQLDNNNSTVSTVYFEYDTLGRLWKTWDSRIGSGNKTVRTYNAYDDVTGVEAPGNGSPATTTLAYDNLGTMTSRVLPAGAGTQSFTYNALGQLIATDNVQQYAVQYQYDDRGGRLRKMITSGSNATTWNYSASGWLTGKRDHADKGADYTWTNGGKLQSREWQRVIPSTSTRVKTTWNYHAHTGELASVDHNDSTPDLVYSFDRLGRSSQVTQAGHSWVYAYDASTLRLDTETINYDTDGNGTADFTRVLDRSQDSLGRSNGWALKNGGTNQHSNTYTFDAAGRLATVTDGTDTFTYSYAANSSDLISTVTSPNPGSPVRKVTNTWASNRDVLTVKQNQQSVSGTLVTASQYTYTVDNLPRRTDVSFSGDAFAASGSVAWAYNTSGEVQSANHSVNASDRYFLYDTLGNRIRARDTVTTDSGGTLTSYTTNILNQYSALSGAVSVSPTNDLDGNQLTGVLPANPGTASEYTWNATNELIEVKSGGPLTSLATYQYDPYGRRIMRDTGGLKTWYFYDGWNLISEFWSSALQRAHTWGLDLSGSLQGAGGVGGLLCSRFGGVGYFPFHDGNGNITEYYISSGTLAAHYEYDAFGRFTASGPFQTTFNFRFSSKYYDTQTGLSYYGFRYYDPVLGRWLSRDPIGEEGGYNLYGAVDNNFINLSDLLGLDLQEFNPNDVTVEKNPPDQHSNNTAGRQLPAWDIQPATVTKKGPKKFCVTVSGKLSFRVLIWDPYAKDKSGDNTITHEMKAVDMNVEEWNEANKKIRRYEDCYCTEPCANKAKALIEYYLRYHYSMAGVMEAKRDIKVYTNPSDISQRKIERDTAALKAADATKEIKRLEKELKQCKRATDAPAKNG